MVKSRKKCPLPCCSNVFRAERGVKGGIMKEERKMAHVARGGICLFGLAVQIALGAFAVAQSPQASTNQQTPLMDREKEIALALSSCPPSVATKAAVYVLEKSGYVKVRD